ncbi:hypothetical protein [Halovulum sp. GXIMD14793]
MRNVLAALAFVWAGAAIAEPVVTGTGGAGDPIVIVLDGPVGGQLAVEVDGADMTDLIRRNGNTLTIQPVPPLPGGPHEVILYAVNGASFDVVVEWQIEGGRAPLIDSASVNATHEVGGTTGSAGPEAFAESSGDLEIIMLDQRLKAGAQYMATTIKANEYGERPINLGEYYLEFTQPTDSMDITARLGHQAVSYDRLVVSNLYKRGTGLRFDRLDQRFALGFFGTQSADGLGIDNFTGIGDRDDRIFGATVAVQPFAASDLTVALTGYAGRGREFDGFLVGEGHAYSLDISGSARDGRLRYGLGAAMSTKDDDAEGAVYDPVDGRAFLAELSYDAIDDDGSDSGMVRTLTFGLSYARVDYDYFSLANPELVPSQETIRLTGDYLTDTTTVSAYLDHQINNVNGPADLETDRIITAGVSGSRSLFSDGNAPGWAGLDPQLNFQLDFTTQDRVRTPLLAPQPLDQTSVVLGVDFATSYDTWSWSLGYAFEWYNDESILNDDSISNGLSFGLEMFPTDRLAYGLSGQVNTVDDFSGTNVDGNIAVNASYELIPAELVLGGSYQMDFSTETFGVNGGVLGADLTWAMSEAADLEFSAGLAHGDQAIVDEVDWFVGALLRFKTNYIR